MQQEEQVVFPGPVSQLAVSPSGRHLAVAVHKEVHLLDAHTLEVKWQGEMNLWRVRNLVFDPAGTTVYSASADTGIVRWSVQTGAGERWHGTNFKSIHPDEVDPHLDAAALLRLPSPKEVILAFMAHKVWGPPLACTSSLLVTGNWDGSLTVQDLEGSPLQELQNHRGFPTSVAFMGPDTLLSAGRDGRLLCWDLQTGQVVKGVEVQADLLAVTRDGKQVVVACRDGHVEIRDTTTLGVEGRFKAHPGQLGALHMMQEGEVLFTVGEDGLKGWSMGSFLPWQDLHLGDVTGACSTGGVVFTGNAAGEVKRWTTGEKPGNATPG